jgi:hypothetical protein
LKRLVLKGQAFFNSDCRSSIAELIDGGDFKNAQYLIDSTTSLSGPHGVLNQIYKTIIDAAMSENNASDDILFYDYQLDVLRQIAQLCPYEYGRGVYIARLMLSRIEPTVYYNSCEDMIEERRFEKSIDNSTVGIKVFPNPAKDEFTIEFSEDISGQQTSVELYNIYGSLVKKIQGGSEAKIVVKTMDLSAGIYYYRVSLNNNVLAKDKIIVIK